MNPLKITKAQNLFSAAIPNRDAILKFLGKYPLHPPDGEIRAGHIEKATALVGGTAPSADDRGHVKFSKQKLTNLVDRVGFVKCADETSLGERGALTFERPVKYADELTTNASRAGYIPIWWLPWNGAGALVKLKIETSATANLNFGVVGIDQVANPKLFVTAAINGCSVFAYGNDLGPTVYHAGLTGNVATVLGAANVQRLGNTSEEVWGNLLNSVHFSGTDIFPQGGATKQTTEQNFSEVNKGDYISERGTFGYVKTHDFVTGHKERTTKRARKFQTWLEGHPPTGNLTAFSISPWGCIFGICTFGHWEMWLQRNATVVHATARKKHSLGAIKWGDLVPTGTAQTNVVTLGLQKFYPTQQAVHYRAFNSVQFV